jgi:predicted SprT family Zn-dependent metalloprotease
MNRTNASRLTRSLMDEHGLLEWTFKWNRGKRMLGQCDFLRKTISLSVYFVDMNDEKSIRDTVLHEIAHALVGPSHGHDLVWWSKARQIGLKRPARVNKHSNMPSFKYIPVCPKCGPLKGGRHRIGKRTPNYLCRICLSRIEWRDTSKTGMKVR